MLKLQIGQKNVKYFATYEQAEIYIPFIVSILNSYSKGAVLFGVNDQGEAIGTSYARMPISSIVRTIEENVVPKIAASVTYLKENRNVIKVEFEGYQKPYSFKGKYYLKDYSDIRTLDYNSIMKEINILNKEFFFEEQKANISYRYLDDRLVKNTYANALNAKRYNPKSSIYSEKSVLESWGLINKQGYVNKAAIYLYSKKSPLSLTINVYSNEKCTEIISTNLYKGNIISLLKFAEEQTKKIYLEKFKIAQRNYQDEPIRELITNAFLHSNFNLSNEIKIIISPYKFTIINPGNFPEHYVPEDFSSSRARPIINNRIIGKILLYEGYAHLNGNGYKTIKEFSKEGKRSIYHQNENFFEFTLLMFPNKYRYLSIDKAVIAILTEKPFIKADGIAERIGKTRRTVQKILKELKEKNLIARKGSNKTGYWIVNR